MTPYSPSTDAPAVRIAAKAKRRADVAADHGAARRVRAWCTCPVPVRGASICIAPPRDDGGRDEDA